jgi:hypothetical protein
VTFLTHNSLKISENLSKLKMSFKTQNNKTREISEIFGIILNKSR